jgi:hypothetical protein
MSLPFHEFQDSGPLEFCWTECTYVCVQVCVGACVHDVYVCVFVNAHRVFFLFQNFRTDQHITFRHGKFS